MSVVLSSAGTVSPGRYADFISQSAEAAKIWERLGASSCRLMTAGFAGEASGTWTFSAEFADMDALGTGTDHWQTDSDALAFMHRMQDSNSPTTITSVLLATEVPLRETKGGRGPIMAVWASKVHPGGMERALELGARANTFAELHGALNARYFTLLGAGSSTGMHTVTWEFDSMRSYLKVMEAFGTEPEGQAIAAAAGAADRPNTLVFEAVYSEIAL
jgi:hypothetical protein